MRNRKLAQHQLVYFNFIVAWSGRFLAIQSPKKRKHPPGTPRKRTQRVRIGNWLKVLCHRCSQPATQLPAVLLVVSAAVSAAETTATATFRLRRGFVHVQRSSMKIAAVQHRNRGFGF